MDFFASQDRARRNTRWLLVLFALAVIGIILVLWALACVGVSASEPQRRPVWRVELLVPIALATLFVVTLGSSVKSLQLRAGGEHVARMLGGRPVAATTTDFAERRLLNVVEEMALAAGIPPPPVFVLDNEESINAFAAGFSPADAVIGVNRGTLRYLNRDELQGVIAHEFSHILNGDMRLNLRLIGLLHGIVLISLIGYYLLRAAGRLSRGGRSRRNDAAVYLGALGVTLWLVGSVGAFFARLIKAAVSRQREYLADAAAVQFTRYPDGIAGALKKIGGLSMGSRMQHPAAEEASHMFFSMAFRTFFTGLFATHPPLPQRIRRIDPSFDGKFPVVRPLVEEPMEAVSMAPSTGRRPPLAVPMPAAGAGAAGYRLDPSAALLAVGQLTATARDYAEQLLRNIPDEIRRAAEEPFGARGVVFAFLLERDEALRAGQLEILEQREGEPTAAAVRKLYPLAASCSAEMRLPILQWVQATLRFMSRPQYEQFRRTVVELVRADRKISLFEFVVQHLLLIHLDRYFLAPLTPPVRYLTVRSVRDAVAVLLSLVAYTGRTSADRTAAAYQEGVKELKLHPAPTLRTREECSIPNIEGALQTLRLASPAVKRRVLSGLFAVAASDAVLTAEEVELLRALAESIDCPMPPLFAAEAVVSGAR